MSKEERCEQRWKYQLHKTEGKNENSHTQGHEGIWDEKMELQRTVQEDKGIRLERESHNSNHWHRRISSEYNGRSETITGRIILQGSTIDLSRNQGDQGKETTRVYVVLEDKFRILRDGLRQRAQLNKLNETGQWSKYFNEVTMTDLLPSNREYHLVSNNISTQCLYTDTYGIKGYN